MSYVVLARKYRPDTFSTMVGQEHVLRALQHALDNDRLHHAYLFTGTRGVGKTTIARLLAKALNCEQGVSASPCGECSRCVEVAENRFVDLIEVDAASRTGVDDTRDLLDNAQYLPSVGRYKVYLIDEVHMLSKAAFNALLKTLEEPPEHVKFLLATTDPKKVPVTVLSRCLQFQLKNLTQTQISSHLTEILAAEGVDGEADALGIIARAAQGSMRDALSLTDQAIAHGGGSVTTVSVSAMLGAVGRDEIGGLLEALAAQDVTRVLQISAELSERGIDFQDVLGGLIEGFHDLAVKQSLQQAIAYDMAPEAVQLNYQIGLMGLQDMRVVPDLRLAFEMTLLRMVHFAPVTDRGALPVASGHDGAEATSATDSGTATGQASAPVPPVANADKQALASAVPETVTVEPISPADQPPVDTPSPSTEQAVAVAAAAQISSVEYPDQAPWYGLVERAQLKGMARMLLEHSLWCRGELTPTPHTESIIELHLDAAHDALYSERQVATVERALSELLVASVTLRVDMASLPKAIETPSARNERLQREAQAQARQSVETDTRVQALLAEFGGEVEQVTVIPGPSGNL